MPNWLEEYAKHAALNLGQVLHGLRYLTSHPTIDRIAPRGSAEHLARSVWLRAKRIGNDAVFTVLPPQWHHTREDLDSLRAYPLGHWFQAGYCPAQFEETGVRRTDLSTADRRWDPRCDDD